MHGLPLPRLDLLITYFIGLRLLKLTLRDSVLWLLITLLFLFVSVTVSHLPSCSGHSAFLDSYAQDLINALLVSARKCIPCRSVSTHQKLAGWSKKVQVLKKACTFWSRVWSEAGCPNSGVLSQIKKIPDLVSSMKCVA